MISKTLLVVPDNDAEARLLIAIAEALGISTWISHQPHGASIDRESGFLSRVKKEGWQQIVIVEMPGVKTEQALRISGKEVVIIDHHQYTQLDRVHDPKTGKAKPSSLEQFLSFFQVTDRLLKAKGFSPRLVRGIGILDRGFVWALQEEGYGPAEIRELLGYHTELLQGTREGRLLARETKRVKRLWNTRETFRGFTLIRHSGTQSMRSLLSFFLVSKMGRPVPLVLWEPRRQCIYLQETPYAELAFRLFGGFTFGSNRNWGYHTEPGTPRVGLREVKKFLSVLPELSSSRRV